MRLASTVTTRRSVAGTGLALTALLLSACSSSSSTTSGSAPSTGGAAPGTASSTGSTAAIQSSAPLHDPASTSRPGAKGKKIVVISSGQASISSSVPSNSAVEAAKALGWSTTLYDEQLNPASAPGLVRQAVAAGADGIVLDATDCPTVKGALQEAKAKNIKVVGIYSFDCNDPIFGGGGEALFSGQINYGAVAASDIGKFTENYGADQAKAVIAATGGKAKVLFFNDQEFTVLRYTGKGFLDELKKCSGCSVVASIDFTGADLGPNLQQKVSSALLQHPEANALKSPYTAATLLGIGPAVVQSGRASKLYVMGGEGFAPELDLIRSGQGLNAVNIAPSDWTAWAAIDTMNSLFNGTPVAESGLGWQLVSKTQDLPAAGPFVPKTDFKAVYKKAWGVA